MREIFLVGIGGALGAVARYTVSGVACRVFGDRFPYGTLTVNVLGCFLMGLVMYLGLARDIVPPAYRLALTVGVLGALTTFSTFSYETVGYLEDGEWMVASANIAANLVLSVLATLGGLVIARMLWGGVQ